MRLSEALRISSILGAPSILLATGACSLIVGIGDIPDAGADAGTHDASHPPDATHPVDATHPDVTHDGGVGMDALHADHTAPREASTADHTVGTPDAPVEAATPEGGMHDAHADAGKDAAEHDASKDAAAEPDAPTYAADLGDASNCLPSHSLAGVGTGDFQISFKINTSQACPNNNAVTLFNQRAYCQGGFDFWDVQYQLNQNGPGCMVTIELASSADGGPVPDAGCGNNCGPDFSAGGCSNIQGTGTHTIVIQRVGGNVRLYVDGNLDAQATGSLNWPAGSLAPLRVFSDVCSGTTPFSTSDASVTDICLSTSFTVYDGGTPSSSCF